MSDPTDLPAGWDWATVDNLTHVGTGTTPRRLETRYWKGGSVPWITSSAVNHPVVTEAEEFVTKDALEETTLRVYPKHTLILALYGEGKTRGKVSELLIEATINQALAALCMGGESAKCRPFLKAFLQSHYTALRRQAAGGMQPNLNLGLVKRIRVPVAPLNEQKRIVAKLDELLSDLDAAVGALERAKVKLARYRAAVLKAAVEGRLTFGWRERHPATEPASSLLQRIEAPLRPNRWATRSKDIIPGHAALSVGRSNLPLPPGWAWSALVDVARMETGHTPSRQHPEWWIGDVPWIGIADAREHHGGVISDTCQQTNEDGLANSAARLLPAGTVCVSRTASVGYVVTMGRPMATSQDFVNWTPTGAVTSGWLRVVFLADRDALLRFGKGSVHKTIYFPEWLSVHIAVPPLAEQEAIVSEVDRLLSVADKASKVINLQLARGSRLRQSILKRAFEGKLVPQDPDDEPASVLLERIKAERAGAERNGQASKKPRRARKGGQ